VEKWEHAKKNSGDDTRLTIPTKGLLVCEVRQIHKDKREFATPHQSLEDKDIPNFVLVIEEIASDFESHLKHSIKDAIRNRYACEMTSGCKK